MNESISIQAFREGDKGAYHQVFNLFYKRLCFFATGIIEASVAEDIVQDTFIKLWERRSSFRNLSSIRAFLFLATKNACLNYYKHGVVEQKYREHTGRDITPENIHYREIEAELLHQLDIALQKLPPGYRTAIHLSYFEGMSNQQIADHVNVSINTIKTQKLRGLQLLRRLFKDLPSGIYLLINLL